MRKILCVILWIQLEAVRDGLKPQSLDLDQVVSDDDDCKAEAKKLKQLLQDLGHPGHGPKGVRVVRGEVSVSMFNTCQGVLRCFPR